MSIRTKHFGFAVQRYPWARPRWGTWWVRIGFFDSGRPLGELPYLYWAGVDIQLLPNFIWWQDQIGVENGRMVIHTRIVGIQNWPFMRFGGGRP